MIVVPSVFVKIISLREGASILVEYRREKQNPFQCLSGKARAANAKFVQHPCGIAAVRP